MLRPPALRLLSLACLALIPACDADTPEGDPTPEQTEQPSMTGQNLVVSRRVLRLNDQHNGTFGFRELTGTSLDGNTGAYRAQLSPDGKVLVRRKSNSTWEVSATRHLARGVKLSGNEIADLKLDEVLDAGHVLGGAAPYQDDNLALAGIRLPFTGNQLAIAFNPSFATKGVPVDDPATCALDTPPAFSARDAARYECLHLMVYARGLSDLPAGSPTCPGGGGDDLCVMLAPLVVTLDHGVTPAADTAPAVARAHFGRFRPIQMNGVAVRSGINEFAASGDGALIFFVNTAQPPSGAADEDRAVIAYSHNPVPYRPLAASPNWASIGWTPAASLWDLYADHVDDTSVVRGIAGGFRRAYPMAQYPFRYSNGVRIRNGLGRYQWFSPEGSDMFVNIGSRAIASVLGRETRGVVKHVDSPAQLTNAVYCSVCAPGQNTGTVDAPKCELPCDPLSPSLAGKGNPGCSRDPRCSNNGLPRFGVQEYTSLGSASGFWATADRDDARPSLPFLRRSPSRYMLFNNKALAFFNQDTSARGKHMWSFGEVANDDFDDPHYLAVFHMTEAIFGQPKKVGTCDFGAAGTACDIEVDFPFANPDSPDSWTADTSRNSALGRLAGGAQFPFDHWRSKGIGERVHGNAERTGEVNPGYRGRAVRFPATGFVDVPMDDSGRLTAAKARFTVEVAIRPEVTVASYTGALAAQAGSWQLGFAAGKLRLTSGAATATAGARTTLTAGEWTHVAVTGEPRADGKSLDVTFYVDGVASPAVLGVPALPAVTAKQKLCIGPGCDAEASSTAVWLDEVAMSDVARSIAYLKNAANQTFVLPGFNAAAAAATWPTLVGKRGVDYTTDADGTITALTGALLGLRKDDLRVPSPVLTEIAGSAAKFAALKGLGRALFHDPLLSSASPTESHRRACSSCHAESAGFTSPAHAAKDDALTGSSLPLNTPTTLNRVFSIRQFLDTRSDDVLDQAVGPILNPAEMGGTMGEILRRIDAGAVPGDASGAGAFVNVAGADPAAARPQGVTTYRQWFCRAFGSSAPCPGVTEAALKLALVTYELTQIRAGSPVDRMRAGLPYTDGVKVGARTMSLKNGYAVFTGQGRCSGCHRGANYSDELRHQSGPLDPRGVPVAAKTPTLRGLALTRPYFHDGSNGGLALPGWCQYTDAESPAGSGLCRVVEFYNRGACRMGDTITIRTYAGPSAAPTPQSMAIRDVSCDPESVSLGLKDQDARDLVQFLMSL